MNNVTNYLSNLASGATKLEPRNEQRSSIFDSYNRVNHEGESSRLKQPPARVSVQQQAREFLDQQSSHAEDLLRIDRKQSSPHGRESHKPGSSREKSRLTVAQWSDREQEKELTPSEFLKLSSPESAAACRDSWRRLGIHQGETN